MATELSSYQLLYYRILSALALQQIDAPFPQTYEVQPQITVTLSADQITVSEFNQEAMVVPAHVRNGRLWLGTRTDEDHLRVRLQAVDDQRTAMGDRLTDAADAALDLSTRTIQDNFLRHYLN